MKKVLVVNKSPEEITACDVDDARIILGLDTEAAFLAHVRDAGGADVPAPFIMMDELRRLGECRALGYQISKYICMHVVKVLAGEIMTPPKPSARKSSRPSSAASAVQSK